MVVVLGCFAKYLWINWGRLFIWLTKMSIDALWEQGWGGAYFILRTRDVISSRNLAIIVATGGQGYAYDLHSIFNHIKEARGILLYNYFVINFWKYFLSAFEEYGSAFYAQC